MLTDAVETFDGRCEQFEMVFQGEIDVIRIEENVIWRYDVGVVAEEHSAGDLVFLLDDDFIGHFLDLLFGLYSAGFAECV